MYCSTCIERRCIAAPHAPSSHQALCSSASRLAAGWVTCHPHTPHTPSSPPHQANSKTRTRTTPLLQYMHSRGGCSNRRGAVAAFNSVQHDPSQALAPYCMRHSTCAPSPSVQHLLATATLYFACTAQPRLSRRAGAPSFPSIAAGCTCCCANLRSCGRAKQANTTPSDNL